MQTPNKYLKEILEIPDNSLYMIPKEFITLWSEVYALEMALANKKKELEMYVQIHKKEFAVITNIGE